MDEWLRFDWLADWLTGWLIGEGKEGDQSINKLRTLLGWLVWNAPAFYSVPGLLMGFIIDGCVPRVVLLSSYLDM